jgi:tubby-related protein 1
LKPIYELYLDDGKRKIITAIKQSLNRTSNYHFFDRTRGQLGSKLSKKNGNYLGKLRAKTSSRTDYVLVTHNSDREEIAGIQFEKHGLFHQLKDGSQPRKMTVILPHLGKHRVPIPNALGNNDAGSMIDMLRDGTGGNRILSFESKDPVFDGGNYRLNFDGRVSMPSVKNFQLVPRNDIDNIALQFGKVGEDTFHLDFKSPLTAFQAFALAICQFNL